jgi:hypothetical protein
VALGSSDVRPFGPTEILHARELAGS